MLFHPTSTFSRAKSVFFGCGSCVSKEVDDPFVDAERCFPLVLFCCDFEAFPTQGRKHEKKTHESRKFALHFGGINIYISPHLALRSPKTQNNIASIVCMARCTIVRHRRGSKRGHSNCKCVRVKEKMSVKVAMLRTVVL
jgi:hypothetical protein